MEITVAVAHTRSTVEYHRVGCQAARNPVERTVDSIEFMDYVRAVKAEQVALNVEPSECETRFHGCLERG